MTIVRRRASGNYTLIGLRLQQIYLDSGLPPLCIASICICSSMELREKAGENVGALSEQLNIAYGPAMNALREKLTDAGYTGNELGAALTDAERRIR